MLATLTPPQLQGMHSNSASSSSSSPSIPTDASAIMPSANNTSAGSDLAHPRLAHPRLVRLAARNRAGVKSFHAAPDRNQPDNTSSPPTSHPAKVRPSSSIEFDQMRLRSTSGSPADARNTSNNNAAKPKKRINSVFGFLTLKESSGVVCDDYDEQQKAATAASAAKAGSTNALEPPAVTNQTLPDHVPKVDSARDDPPQDPSTTIDQQKKRERAKRPSLSCGRITHRTTLSSVSDGPHSPKLMVGTLTSRPQSLAIQRVSFRNSAASRSSSSSDASFRTTRMEITSAQSAIMEEPVGSTFLDSPSRPPTTLDHNASSDSSTEAHFVSEFRSSPVAAYLSGACVDYSDKIPVDLDSEVPGYPSYMQPLSFQGNRTVWYSDTDADDSAADVKASELDVPTPSEVIFWSPSKSPPVQTVEEKASEASEDENWPLPAPPSTKHRQPRCSVTSQTTVVTSPTSTVSPTFSRRLSDMTQQSSPCSPIQTRDLNRFGPTKSNRSSASSTMSAQWTQSPKQRLGLGGTVRKADLLPWEIREKPADLIGINAEPAEHQPKRRLSIMLGRR